MKYLRHFKEHSNFAANYNNKADASDQLCVSILIYVSIPRTKANLVRGEFG